MMLADIHPAGAATAHTAAYPEAIYGKVVGDQCHYAIILIAVSVHLVILAFIYKGKEYGTFFSRHF
jgi:hypothetical protein